MLMLAAVFAMHGLQCTAAEHSTTSGHDPMPGTAVTLVSSLTADGHPADAAPPGLGHSMTGDQVTGPFDAAPGTGHGTVPHQGAGHLWTLCPLTGPFTVR
jgi:hypothetical protein